MQDLYRFYNENGTLLYIGVSLSALQRTMQHRTTKDWWDEVRRMEVEKFSTRGDALDAEAQAIRTERPLYNIQHSTRPRRDVWEYAGWKQHEGFRWWSSWEAGDEGYHAFGDFCHAEGCDEEQTAPHLIEKSEPTGRSRICSYECVNGHAWRAWWNPAGDFWEWCSSRGTIT